MTTLTIVALAYAVFVGWSVCRAIGGYDKAQEECDRDRNWWMGLLR